MSQSSSTTNHTEDSWAKLEISPRSVASMKFLNYRINIYASSGGLTHVDAKDKKYYYAPISLLDPQSAVSGFNNATGEFEMRFRVYLWTESVEKEVFNHLTKKLGIETSIHQVHVIPFQQVILVSTQQTVNYRVHKEWIPYQSDQYLEFRIICDTKEFCDHLAKQMRDNPRQFAHLKLQFSLDSQRSKRRETVIRIENIVSGSMFSKLDQKFPNSKEVYLTAADTKRLLSETVSNVLAETFSDDEILHQSAESAIYKSLEQFIVSGNKDITKQSETMWDSVFWDQDNYRPDRSSKEISEVYRNSVSDAQQKMAETFSESGKISNDIGVTFTGFSFNNGFKKENTNSNSKEKEDFLKLMKESKDHVQWEGEKFIPKPMQLSRVNLAQIRNAQNFRDIRTRVTYTQSVLSTTIKMPNRPNAQSLELLVTESKFSDTAAQLLQKMADLENNTAAVLQLMSVEEEDNGTPLHIASQTGHAEVVKLLLDRGANINGKAKDNWTPLHLASEDGHAEVVELLLDRGADINSKAIDNLTPLHSASHNGHAEVVESLLDRGAESNCKDKYNWTPLHIASQKGRAEVVKLLLDFGADRDAKTKSFSNALQLASLSGHAEIVNVLLDRGADINSKGKDNWTPLHLASQNGHAEVVNLLLDRGAGINSKGKDNWTPLHLASHNGHAEVVNLLLERRADINCQDKNGKTPLQLASHNGHTKVIDLLQNLNR